MAEPVRSVAASAAHTRSLNVLVVDDSAVVRQLMTALLSETAGIAVVAAADPLIAMRKMKQSRPDVIVLDIEMPRMDGLTFLRKIMAEDPIPVVICSGHVGAGTRTALEALAEGAVEIIAKPSLGVRDFLQESALTLADTVRAAAHARVLCRARPGGSPAALTADAVLPLRTRPARQLAVDKVVAIGVSTGGPQALELLLGALPPDAPGIVAAQHMPEGFTAALARRLDRFCSVEVREARSGDAVLRGRALIAPGGRHLVVAREGMSYAVRVVDGPLVSRHRPSVDVLFRSVAQTAGPNGVGVIMTGMGNDGAAGLAEMKQAGAVTLAQDESSSVVFGMPKAAIDRGAVDRVLRLDRLANAIVEIDHARQAERIS